MKNAFGLGAFGLGIALMIAAFCGMGADAPGLSWLTPAHSSWLLVGGVVAVLSGLVLAFTGARRRDF